MTAPRLIPETDRDGCRCGAACPGCGNCTKLATYCGWCRCDGSGLVNAVSGYEAQLAARRGRRVA